MEHGSTPTANGSDLRKIMATPLSSADRIGYETSDAPGSTNCLLTHSHRPCIVSCGPRVNPLIRLGPVPPPPNVSSWSYGPLAACQSAWGARRLSPPDPVLETPLPPVKTHPPLSETTFRKFPERGGV